MTESLTVAELEALLTELGASADIPKDAKMELAAHFYGLCPEAPPSIRLIAMALGVSKQYVQQVELRALHRLRMKTDETFTTPLPPIGKCKTMGDRRSTNVCRSAAHEAELKKRRERNKKRYHDAKAQGGEAWERMRRGKLRRGSPSLNVSA